MTSGSRTAWDPHGGEIVCSQFWREFGEGAGARCSKGNGGGLARETDAFARVAGQIRRSATRPQRLYGPGVSKIQSSRLFFFFLFLFFSP